MPMAHSNRSDSAPWVNLRLEELVRLLQIHNNESEKRRDKFQNKLEELKERQDHIQQRRIERLRREGIVIDLEALKRRVRAPEQSHWFDEGNDESSNRSINEMGAKIKEMFKLKESNNVNDIDTISEYDEYAESEIECTAGVDDVSQSRAPSRGPSREQVAAPNRRKTPTTSRILSREPSRLGLIKESEVMADTNASVKSVGIKVKKQHTDKKKGLKTVGNVLTTAKYIKKMHGSKKRKDSTSKDKA